MDKGAKDKLVVSPGENGRRKKNKKRSFTQELEGTKRTERPSKGWREEVERDHQVLGVRRWRELVTDRTKWRDIVRQVKAHNGLWCQWKKKKNTPTRGKILHNCVSRLYPLTDYSVPWRYFGYGTTGLASS
jgi:hypothetical protein